MRLYAIAVVLSIMGASFFCVPPPDAIKVTAPTPASLTAQLQAEQKQAAYDEAEEAAARIFKRHGCSDEFAEYAGHNAVDFHIPARIVSALIIVESSCRPHVVSSEGAIGLMQIVPKVWHVKAEQLRDPAFNIHKGTEILSSYVRAHGLREGLHHYNGMGVGCETCDGQYGSKVLLVAGYIR